MKKYQFTLLVFLIFTPTIFSCSKERFIAIDEDMKIDSEISVTEAQKWYANQVASARKNSNSKFKVSSVLWENALSGNLSIGRVIIIPIEFEDNFIPRIADKAQSSLKSLSKNEKILGISELSNMIIYKDNEGEIHGEIVSSIPDESFYKRKDGDNNFKFSGYVWVRNIEGVFLKGFEYQNGNNIRNIILNEESSGKNGKVASTLNYPCGEVPVFVSVCIPTLLDYCDIHYSHSIPVYCDDNASSSSFGPSNIDYYNTGGGSYENVTQTLIYDSFEYAGEGNLIVDIQDELKCFMTNSDIGYSYKISVCVDQPVAGSRAMISNGNVGHTFVQFSKINNQNGEKITRSIGFYPTNGPKSILSYVSSTIRDNSQTSFDVSVSYDVTAEKFSNGINAALSWSNTEYSLENYNCTDAAFSVCNAAGVYIPKPMSKFMSIPCGTAINCTYTLFLHSPGGLGESLRNLPSQSGRVVNTNGGVNGNAGSCN